MKYFNIWRDNIGLINHKVNHIMNNNGHCFSVEKIIVKEKRCGIHNNSETNCECSRAKYALKRIFIRFNLLKQLDKKKYFLFLWFKNTFDKIRLIEV